MQIDAAHIRDSERPSRLDVFDPRCRVLCAVLLAVVLASVRFLPGLLPGSLVPFLLLFAGEPKALAKMLVHVNAVTVFVWILLPITTPGPWGEGLRLALLVTCKLNLISVVLIRMIAELGMGRIDNVLSSFHFSEKMRVLLLLTMRYVFLLMDCAVTMTRAICLRAPALRGTRLYSAFACMLGTTLIHSAARAERSMLAMRCRGGMTGFARPCLLHWRPRDTLLCAFFAVNAAAVVVVCLYA
ncbi:MAG: energy-coupling factor transporter transmembrane protein EcfT [Synergistaceae bacterium]|jgi:hypothetical protein|nr:energy-coupling factor transporter transmembrane protein EcfT [Synergistaceae bacterium]